MREKRDLYFFFILNFNPSSLLSIVVAYEIAKGLLSVEWIGCGSICGEDWVNTFKFTHSSQRRKTEQTREEPQHSRSCVFSFSIYTHFELNCKPSAVSEQQQPQLMTLSTFFSIFYPHSVSHLCIDRQKKGCWHRNSHESLLAWELECRTATTWSNAVESWNDEKKDCLVIDSNFVCLFSIKRDCDASERVVEAAAWRWERGWG